MERSPRRLPPLELGPDTWLLRLLHDDEVVNAAVLLGPEPVLVGTGPGAGRRLWWDAVWSLVEPADVRWVLVGDDDPALVGNLAEAVACSPQATVVATAPALTRLVGDGLVPAERGLVVEPGDVVPVVGRPQEVLRPLVYAPTASVGFFDLATGTLWAGACFTLPAGAADGVDADPHRALAPWQALVEPEALLEEVERFARLGVRTIVSLHDPPITEPAAAVAFLDRLVSGPPERPAPPN